MPDGEMTGVRQRPLLWVAIGRQRVGKTALLNAAVQYFRLRGSPIEVWNADVLNRSHTLSMFFDDAHVPGSGSVGDTQHWIEARLADQAGRGYHAVLDAGGGWTGFSSLVEDVPIVESLASRGIGVVGLFVVGPEQADLDYLDRFGADASFLPPATVIVLNAGLVMSGRSSNNAFNALRQKRVFMAAVGNGACVVTMPTLSCMSEVTDRGLTFAEAAEGVVKPGQEPMSLFDPARVRSWWTTKVPEFFGQFPREWLPLQAPGSPIETVGQSGA